MKPLIDNYLYDLSNFYSKILKKKGEFEVEWNTKESKLKIMHGIASRPFG